ncbi:carboxypeptidase regulatory-like domain-containing protein [Variovorax sp.]|jgi:uncharacterized protein YfaP (DUF2135 family)|uniref:carboxypeptidase regulatory-like domain-containing protein n=1 Tax=Variovorax sp. TaxID=1871043 RepID=UPI0025EE80DD|nr:carboxypeptidase regulatory-like domain-containing protein [Variovorax sp.]
MRFKFAVAAVAVALAVAACGGGGGGSGFGFLPPGQNGGDPGDPGGPGGPGTPARKDAKVTGRVTNALDGAGIAQVKVTAGGVSATTADDGSYTLEGITNGASVLLSYEKNGFAPQSRSTAALAPAEASTVINIPMLPVAFSDTFNPGAARDLAVPGSTAMVRLPANALRRADGSTPTGQVTGRLTPIAPATNVNLMPGNYLAATSGEPAAMESFGALDASFVDADGAPLKLAQGVSATVRIAPSSRSAALPPTVPLFFYNTATGLWVEEGSASLQGTAPNQYYEGTVTHFTTWNADQIYNTVRVNGCVQNAAGERVAGAVVASEGKSYSGVGSAVTNANGEFSVPAKRSSEAFVVASKNAELSNAANATLGDQDITLGGCLTLTSSAMSIKLTWGERPYDLDSHTMGANVGEEVYYANKGSLAAAPFIGLDVDDVDSFGPEYTTFAKLARNRTYRFFVYNFSDTYDPGQTGSPARVELSNRGAQSVFSPPAGEVTDSTRYWHVFDLRTDDNCNATVVPVQKFLANKPPEVNTDANAQYCN